MPACIVCNETYADNLRRCPRCGASPSDELLGAPGTAPSGAGAASLLSSQILARRRRIRLLVAVAGAGVLLLVGAAALILPSGGSDAEADLVAASAPGAAPAPDPAAGAEDPAKSGVAPIPPATGFAVLEARSFGDEIEVSGTCSTDAVGRVLVDGFPATIDPGGATFRAVVPSTGRDLEVVAEGLDGTREVRSAPPPPYAAEPPGGEGIRVKGVAEGETLPGPAATLEIEAAQAFGLPERIEAPLPGVRNAIAIGPRRFLLYRAPPGLTYLRTTATGHRTFLRVQDGQEMVLIPGGIFRRGAGETAPDGPLHFARLRPFLIDRTEVTCRQYAEFLAFMRRANDPSLRNPEDPGHSLVPRDWTGDRPPEGSESLPVTGVHWYAAYAYARWVEGRLPTEAEWERAAAGTNGLPYPWGDRFDPARCRARAPAPLPADSMPAGEGPCSLLHMSGNVREWCSDRFDPRWLARGPRVDPTGPASGQHRVLRGGSFNGSEADLRLQRRDQGEPTETSSDVGFRVVRDWRD